MKNIWTFISFFLLPWLLFAAPVPYSGKVSINGTNFEGDAQFTFAIAAAGRGFDARIATEFDAELPDSACVYCGNCIGVCPTGALKSVREHELREDDDWHPESETVTTTICSFCGVGCNLELHVQQGSIVNVTSPADHSVTHGHLCIKAGSGSSTCRTCPRRKAAVACRPPGCGSLAR